VDTPGLAKLFYSDRSTSPKPADGKPPAIKSRR
jgi:hypothetical protein